MTKETTCPECGHSLKNGSFFCGGCGNKLDDQVDSNSQNKPAGPASDASESKLPWIVLAVGVIATLAVIFMFVFSSPDSGQPEMEVVKETAPATPRPEDKAEQKNIAEGEKSVSVQEKTEKEAEEPPTVPAGNRGEAENLLKKGIKQAQQGNLEKATELFAKAADADQSYALAWNNLGIALKKQGDTDNAIKAYSAAINAQPEFALAYKNMGLVLDETGETEAAVGAYKMYCDLAPDAKDFDTIQARMKQLLSQMK